MPRKQRRTRRERDLASAMILATAPLVGHLLTGSPVISGAGFHNVTKFRRAWELTRATLLPRFIASHPGRRPFAWWLIDHGKERPVIESNLPPRMTAEHFRAVWGSAEHFGYLHTRLSPPMQEPERDYLKRNGLLTDAERVALKGDQ